MHGDVAWSNIIYFAGSAVWIDFGLAEVERPIDPQMKLGTWEIQALLSCFYDSFAFRGLAREWDKTCREKDPELFKYLYPWDE
jgi:hypothetical protein